MQEHQYESFASEPERGLVMQGAGDRWSEGEKIQVEPKHMNGLSPSLTIILVVVILLVLLVVFFLLAGISIYHGSHIHVLPGPPPGGGVLPGAPGGGPGPIQKP